MNKSPLTVQCPTCGTVIPWIPEQQWKPFCSERCKLIDLGEWAEGNMRIPGKPCYDEELNKDDEEQGH